MTQDQQLRIANFQGYATGYFVAPYTGSITFYLSSDDLSDLVINVNGTNNELQLSTCCTTVMQLGAALLPVRLIQSAFISQK